MMIIGRGLALAFLAAGMAAGCGGSGGSASGGGDLTGSVHGSTIGIQDAISAAVTITQGTTTAHGAVILLSTSKTLCADAMTTATHPNEKAVIITLFDVNGMTLNTPTAPGTYTIAQSGTPPAKAAVLDVSAVDATCNDDQANDASATSGSVVLTSASGNAFHGTFDVVLDSGDHVTGDFSPQECPALQTALTTTSSGTCK